MLHTETLPCFMRKAKTTPSLHSDLLRLRSPGPASGAVALDSCFTVGWCEFSPEPDSHQGRCVDKFGVFYPRASRRDKIGGRPRRGKTRKPKESIEKSVQQIFAKAVSRKQTTREDFYVDWEASLELLQPSCKIGILRLKRK